MGNVQKNLNKNPNIYTNLIKSKNEEGRGKKKTMNPKQFFSQIFKINKKSLREQDGEKSYQIPNDCDDSQNFKDKPNDINIQSNSFETNPNSLNNYPEEENEDFSENSSEEIEEKNNEFGNDKLYLTKSIKKVFVETKRCNDIKNRDNSIPTFDYELNFYHGEETLRGSYISKLISTKIWNPQLKNTEHNSVIIFDWDDTLLPTSFLVSDGPFQEEIELSRKEKEKMKQIEKKVGSILEKSIEKGNTYIITNSGVSWIEYNARQWKIEAFLNILRDVDDNKLTNIVCMGDSIFEIEAGRILASKFARAFIKTVKFKESPKIDELLEQLKLVYDKFGYIYSSIKNLNIRLEKKKK